METVEDLGRKVKAKHPGQYDDLSDAEVGRRVKDKFPGQYDDFAEVSVAQAGYIPPQPTPTTVLSTPATFTDEPSEPLAAGENQSALRSISIVLWIIAAVCFLLVVAGDGGIAPLFLSVMFVAVGALVWKKGDRAFEDEAKEVSHKTAIKRKQIEFKTEVIRERQNDSSVRRTLELAAMYQETQAQAELVRRAELDNRRRLIEIGKDQGLTPESVSAVNEHKYRTEIDLERRWREIVQDLDAGDLLELSEQQLVKKLTGYLAEQLRDRHAIEVGDDPSSVKEALLARYDKNISYLEAKIDARQTGLLLSENGQEAKRLGEGEDDGWGYSEPEAEAAPEQVPPKRPRGRPRKNLSE